MFLDTFFIFLNVLEQFAIRANTNLFWVEFTYEDIVNFVNKLYFRSNDDFIKNLMEEIKIKNSDLDHVDPKFIVKESLKDIDRKIVNDAIFNDCLYNKLHYIKDIHFRFIY
jgi:hypothetical protein